MKTFYLTSIIAVFLLLCANGLQAQTTTKTKLNQVELFKQFTGTWKAETGKDTTFTIEDTFFGDGHVVYLKTETKGKIIWEGKSLIGYDKKNDVLIESILGHNSPNISLSLIRFLSTNKFEEILLEEIFNPEKATEKNIVELISPDLQIATYMKNNKIVSVDTFKRVK
jgi:hypothetical protein